MPLVTPLALDLKTASKAMELSRNLKSMVAATIIGCFIPIIWIAAICMGLVCVIRRKSFLKRPEIAQWLNENAGVDFKALASMPTLEGNVANIYISGMRAWVPVLVPVLAVGVVVILIQFV